MTNTGPFILCLEDDENDMFFVSRAFTKVKGPRLEVVATGKEAIEYLTRAAGTGAERPSLVLLDLNVPYVSGHEVLAWIRAQPHYHDLPVIIFTSSAQDSDVARAYANGATGYVTKPNAPARMVDVATNLLRVLQSPLDAALLLQPTPGYHPPPTVGQTLKIEGTSGGT